MISVDLITATTASPRRSPSRSADARVMMDTSSWSPIVTRTSAMTPSIVSAARVPLSWFLALRSRPGRSTRSRAERVVQIAAVEEPLASDPTAGKSAFAGEGLNPLDVQTQVLGGFSGADELHILPQDVLYRTLKSH